MLVVFFSRLFGTIFYVLPSDSVLRMSIFKDVPSSKSLRENFQASLIPLFTTVTHPSTVAIIGTMHVSAVDYCVAKILRTKSVSFSSSPVYLFASEIGQKFHRQWKNDCRIFLGRYAVECLQVAQLEGRGRFVDDVGSLLQRPSGFVFSFGCYHLQRRGANSHKITCELFHVTSSSEHHVINCKNLRHDETVDWLLCGVATAFGPSSKPLGGGGQRKDKCRQPHAAKFCTQLIV